jgi:circadian clock protein KaiC
MVDTWMMVQDIEVNALRTRSLCIMKSRGMEHATDVRRFIISKKGITLSAIQSNMDGSEGNAKRKAREHSNLSISAESIKETENVRSKK